MVSVPEIVTWVIGLVVLLFGTAQYQYLRRLPYYLFLILSYGAMVMAWTVTILEGFFWETLFIVLEHSFQLVSAILLAVWCCRVVRKVGNDA